MTTATTAAPPVASTPADRRYLHRHSGLTRFNHWIMVMLFGMAGFSGLALFHPNLFPLSAIFGGPQWTRIVHPYFGVCVYGAFLFFLVRFWRVNLPNMTDVEWVKHSADMLAGNQTAMPPVDKYNAGQKGVFWGTCLALTVLLATGVLFWQPWFGHLVPIPVQRLAIVLHSAAAFFISLMIVIHIYAALWVKGTVRAMTQGTVSAGWAKQHHYLWHRKVLAKPGAIAEKKP